MLKAYDAYDKAKANMNTKMSTIMSVVEEIILHNCEQGFTNAFIREDDIFKNTDCDDARIMDIVKNILLENGYEAAVKFNVINSNYNGLAIKVSWDKPSINVKDIETDFNEQMERVRQTLSES